MTASKRPFDKTTPILRVVNKNNKLNTPLFFKIKSKTLVFTYNRYFGYLYISPSHFCIFIHFLLKRDISFFSIILFKKHIILATLSCWISKKASLKRANIMGTHQTCSCSPSSCSGKRQSRARGRLLEHIVINMLAKAHTTKRLG